MSEREIKIRIEELAGIIAEILCKGKDCEIRKSKDGVTVAEIGKKVVVR